MIPAFGIERLGEIRLKIKCGVRCVARFFTQGRGWLQRQHYVAHSVDL